MVETGVIISGTQNVKNDDILIVYPHALSYNADCDNLIYIRIDMSMNASMRHLSNWILHIIRKGKNESGNFVYRE